MENSKSTYTYLHTTLISESMLTKTVDPEMRAEFEKQSRSSPISGGARNAMAGGGGPGNFDLAGWMAGTAPGPMAGVEAAAQGATTGRENGGARRRG